MVGCVALHMCRGILVSKAQGQEMKILWSTNIKNPGVAFNSALKFLYLGYFSSVIGPEFCIQKRGMCVCVCVSWFLTFSEKSKNLKTNSNIFFPGDTNPLP